MGTSCAPLVADLFLFCYERDFIMYLSGDRQANNIDAFNKTSRYLDDILNINYMLKTKSNFTLLLYIPFLGIGEWYFKCV